MIIIKVLITITTATTTIMIIIITIILIIITNRYSKLTRSSYRYYFPYCFFPLNKMLFNSVFVRIDIVCCFQEIRQFINTRCHIWTNFLSVIDFPQCLAWFKERSPSSGSVLINQFKYIIHIQRTEEIEKLKDYWANTLFESVIYG